MSRVFHLVLLVAACTRQPPWPSLGADVATGDVYEWNDREVAEIYPDIEALYAGTLGIYRTCGPNNNVCHSGREYPNMRTLGALLENIGAPCNRNADRAIDIHDSCETEGDYVLIRDARIEVAYFEAAVEGEPPRTWRMVLRSTPPEFVVDDPVVIERSISTSDEAVDRTLYLRNYVLSIERDPEHEAALLLELAPAPSDPGMVDLGAEVAEAFENAGVSGAPASPRVGDPNRNGFFGRELEHALIKPGDPEASYLMRRLVDPSYGVLMPLANCCSWHKSSLRALWCWISGLDPDGLNASDAIDYESCPEGPTESVVYPVLGDACEASGMCPVTSRVVSGDPTWEGIWAILQQSCAGSDCHIGGDNDDLTIPMNSDDAYDVLQDYVVPGDPGASELYLRLLPTCETPTCERMPLDRAPLTSSEIELIQTWITNGAAEE